jgi:iron complex transport system permease protein
VPVLVAATAVVAILALVSGPAPLTPGEVVAALFGGGDERTSVIVRDVRLPRILLALVVGASLAAAGTVFQALFRNPLADPFVLGVSGGASLGAVLATVSGVSIGFLGLDAPALSAFAGALGAALLALAITTARGPAPVADLLLAGFAIGAFCSALVSVLLLLNMKSWGDILFWMLGSLDRADAWPRIKVALPCACLSLAVIALHVRAMNLLLLGEDTAQQLGVEVERVKRRLLFAGVIATGSAVSTCGIIGFVGLVVPHMARRSVGPDHRLLLPVAVLGGGLALLAADALSRVVIAPVGLPVGSVTALGGAPFFLYLLHRRRRGVH